MLQTKRDVQILKTREKEVEILKAKREKKIQMPQFGRGKGLDRLNKNTCYD